MTQDLSAPNRAVSPRPPRMPQPGDDQHVRSIALDIVLTLVTCGIWNVWLQHKQMLAVNRMLGTEKYRFLPWLGLTLVTCGLWHVYHEYRVSNDIATIMTPGNDQNVIICLLLSLFGFSIVADAIQQSEINKYFGHHGL